jgi:hypothetical protein
MIGLRPTKNCTLQLEAGSVTIYLDIAPKEFADKTMANLR